jgi:hypothetical protein
MPDPADPKPWPPAEDLPEENDPFGEVPPEDRLTRIGFVLAGGVVVLSLAFWVWAFGPWVSRENPDRLESRAFPERAEVICGEANDAIDALPDARTATSPQDRALVVEEANDILAAMVDDLRATPEATVNPDDAVLIGLWLDDYTTFVEDRREHAAKLAAGEDVQLTVTAIPEVGPIDGRIDGFARVNDMDACEVPLDV